MALDILQAVQTRIKSYGISTAAPFLRQFEQCLGGNCPSKYFENVSEFRWRKAVEAAQRQLVYHHPEMDFDGDFARFEKAVEQAGLPPHTVATFPGVITTTRQDRDGDVLETKGAELDPKLPLLYQHMPFENIGRLLKETKHTSKLLAGEFSICGTPLGEDCAMLAEHGALRISHGFTTDDYEPLDEKEYEVPGFHVTKFKILEVSLVSIPSNPDAEITAFSRNKLHHPLTKALAESKFRARPAMEAVLDLSALANSLPAGASITVTKAAEVQPVEQKTVGCACQKDAEPVAKSDAAESDSKGIVKTAMHVESKAAVVSYKKTPTSDSTTWDADSAVSGLRKWAGVDADEPTDAAFAKYQQGFGIVDGAADNLTSYKYPHHEVNDGKLTVNFKGCAAVIAALNGGRGGTTLSETDRKALYNHVVKHYKDSFPDAEVPELKLTTPLRYKGKLCDFYNPEHGSKNLLTDSKGVYVEFSNSFDGIRCDLNDALLAYLIANRVADSADYCYIVDLFLYQALVCVVPRRDCCYWGNECSPAMYGPWNDEDNCYFMIDWEMGADEEPVWTGAPQPVEVTPQITELDKRARQMFVKGLRASHVRKLKKAMDHLQKAMDHEEVTDAVSNLAGKAHGHVKAVHDAHAEKSVIPAEHIKKLQKAMDHCSKGAEHEEAKPEIVKAFNAAGVHVKDVMDDMDMGGEESLDRIIRKAGRRFSAANVKRLKSAASNFKAIADDEDSHADVAEMGTRGYASVKSLFATGGDSGSDFGADDEYTGDDLGAYTADGESGKAGRAVSKESAATIQEAIGHAKSIMGHKEADAGHKAMAKKAGKKLSAVLGEPENTFQNDNDGDMSLHGGNPTGDAPVGKDADKSAGELCDGLLKDAVVLQALTGSVDGLKSLAGTLDAAHQKTQDTIARIERQSLFDSEEALLVSAAASV